MRVACLLIVGTVLSFAWARHASDHLTVMPPEPAPPAALPVEALTGPPCSVRLIGDGAVYRLRVSLTNYGASPLELTYREPFVDLGLSAHAGNAEIAIERPAHLPAGDVRTISIPGGEMGWVSTPIELRFDPSAELESEYPARWLVRGSVPGVLMGSTLTFDDRRIGPCTVQRVREAPGGMMIAPPDLVVRARVVRGDTAQCYCGMVHVAAAREYEVLEVLEGSWTSERIFAIESCPEPGPNGIPSGVFRLELHEDTPMYAWAWDTLGRWDAWRFYIDRASRM